MPGVLMVEAMAQAGAVAALSAEENRGKLALFAGIDDVRFKRIVVPGRRARADLRARAGAWAGRSGQGDGDGGRGARRARDADVRRDGRDRVIANVSGNGIAVGLTGLGVVRTGAGADERRPRGDGRDLRRVDRHADRDPGAADRRTRAGGERPRPARRPGRRSSRPAWTPRSSTSSSSRRPRPTCSFRRRRRSSPTRSARRGRPRTTCWRGAPASSTRSRRRTAQVATGLSKRALVIGSEVLSKITNWNDRSTCILFGDGAGAAVVQPVEAGGIVGFELGADGSGGPDLCVPGGGSRSRSHRTRSRRSCSSSG